MSLGDHLRELRNRVTIAAVAILAGGVLSWSANASEIGRASCRERVL